MRDLIAIQINVINITVYYLIHVIVISTIAPLIMEEVNHVLLIVIVMQFKLVGQYVPQKKHAAVLE